MPEELLVPDDKQFRDVLGHFATGVTIITAMDGDEPVGMAANSFTSLSLDPPLSCSASRTRRPRGRASRQAGKFAVNILGEDHEELSRLFAKKGADRFAPDAVAHAACRARRCSRTPSPTSTADFEAEYPGGDHKIIVGRVLDLDMREGSRPAPVLQGRVRAHARGVT